MQNMFYIIIFFIVVFRIWSLRSVTGKTRALDSRIKTKLKLYNILSSKYPKAGKEEIYRKLIEMSVGFENQVDWVIEQAKPLDLRQIVLIMMIVEFNKAPNRKISEEITQIIFDRVYQIIPDNL